MKNEATELTLKEKINDGLTRHWKLATIIFTTLLIIMAVILVIGYLNRGKVAESAMLAEDIQSSYTAWMQEAPENRDNTELEAMISRGLEDYPKMFAAQRALFTRGLMALENKEWDVASEAFETLADNWDESYLAPVSLYNAGAAREEAGDPEGAGALWQRLVDNYAEVSPDAPEALFNLGRLAEENGDTSEAVGFYKDVNSRFPKSRWTDLSKSRILVLEGRS